MKYFISVLAMLAMLCATNVMAEPIAIDQFVTPEDLSLNGNLSWDTDQEKPEANSDGGGAPGFGTSSFYSNVQGSQAGNSDDRDYTALRIQSDFFGLKDLTIGDITGFTYWTKNTDISLRDWQVKIYTQKPYFFGSYYRLNFTPGRATNNEWTKWSLFGDNALGLEHVRQISFWGGGSYIDNPQLANYQKEKIHHIDIIAGYMTDSPAVYSYLDGVEITYRGENTIRLDLGTKNDPPPSSVPEPGASVLFGLGLLSIAAIRRNKNFF